MPKMERRLIFKMFIVCVTIISAFLSSCNYNSRQEIVGKKVACDSLLLFRNRNFSVVSDTVFKNTSVLLWIDSTKCSQCELEHLGNYESFNDHCEKILGKEGRMKVVISLSGTYSIGQLINDVQYLNLSFDPIIDYKNLFPSVFNCNDRLLFVLKDGRVIKYYHMENNEGDAYKMRDCLEFLRQMYKE